MVGLGLIQQERVEAIEDRRKMLQRKNIGDVYRKNLQFTQLKKNPVLKELEDLLLGHKEINLFKKHKEEITPQEQATIREMQQAQKNVRAHELTQKTMDEDAYSEISSIQPSNDVRNVASKNRLQNPNTEEIAYFNKDSLKTGVSARFSKDLKLNRFADTIFGRSYEGLYRERLYKKATATYTIHLEMAKNGYRPGNESTFSIIA